MIDDDDDGDDDDAFGSQYAAKGWKDFFSPPPHHGFPSLHTLQALYAGPYNTLYHQQGPSESQTTFRSFQILRGSIPGSARKRPPHPADHRVVDLR
jgi:hypothetical protein